MIYNSIQYLRGISAIAVVFFHLFHTTGQQGVAIFFVISGFIMIDIMNKKHRDAKEFFKARFIRVAPIYYMLTLLTLGLGIAYDPTWLRIIQSFTFTALGSLLPVGWTLTFEFIFYTVVTLSIAFINNYRLRIFMIVFFLVVGDTALNYLLSIKNYEYGNYFWFFIAGILVYEIYQKQKKIFEVLTQKYLLYILLIFSFVYLFCGVFFIPHYDISVNNYIVNNLVPSFFIVLSVLLIESKYHTLNNTFMILLGNASYSIYLTHFIVIHSFEKYISLEISPWILFVLSILIGCCFYKLIEKPFLEYLKSLGKVRCVG
ncbi:acyltransferase family protein [Sulfurimonas sp.]|uniref:acyltransferase family protein n=1 Tax=Sulfurimonas sp. TaxID=2022749 RepID=UPI003D1214A6